MASKKFTAGLLISSAVGLLISAGVAMRTNQHMQELRGLASEISARETASKSSAKAEPSFEPSVNGWGASFEAQAESHSVSLDPDSLAVLRMPNSQTASSAPALVKIHVLKGSFETYPKFLEAVATLKSSRVSVSALHVRDKQFTLELQSVGN